MNNIINICHYMYHCNINDIIIVVIIIIIIIKFIILLSTRHIPVICHEVHAPLHCILNLYFLVQDDLLNGHTLGDLIIIIIWTYLNVLIYYCSKLKHMIYYNIFRKYPIIWPNIYLVQRLSELQGNIRTIPSSC
jgi:hypothetical protein